MEGEGKCPLQYNNAEGVEHKETITRQRGDPNTAAGCGPVLRISSLWGGETVYLSYVLKTGCGTVPSLRSTCDVK